MQSYAEQSYEFLREVCALEPGTLLYIYDGKQLIGYISVAILTIILSFTITWFFGVPKEYMEEDEE